MRAIHRSPVNSTHKRPVTRKMFPFDDVIMVPVTPSASFVLNLWYDPLWVTSVARKVSALALCVGIHHSPHKSQWRGALMFCLICARINGWVNNREAGDLRRHRAHYDVTVMLSVVPTLSQQAIITPIPKSSTKEPYMPLSYHDDVIK